jgi:hypothetical protein
MESNKMNVRHILAAVSAAAILAGSSYGALASSHHHALYSKGWSSSSIVIDAESSGNPEVDLKAKGKQTAFSNDGNGATASSSTWGGGAVLQGTAEVEVKFAKDSGPLKSVEVSTNDGTAALAVGGTSGCASAGGASC